MRFLTIKSDKNNEEYNYVVLKNPGVFNSDDSRPDDPCKNHTKPQCNVEYFYSKLILLAF